MKIKNLQVDAAKIGAGLYDIICERGESAIVAFGMIPLWVVEMTEKQLREKIISEAAKQVQCTADELRPIVDEKLVAEITRPIMHEITLEIYRAASAAGMLRV